MFRLYDPQVSVYDLGTWLKNQNLIKNKKKDLCTSG